MVDSKAKEGYDGYHADIIKKKHSTDMGQTGPPRVVQSQGGHGPRQVSHLQTFMSNTTHHSS